MQDSGIPSEPLSPQPAALNYHPGPPGHRALTERDFRSLRRQNVSASTRVRLEWILQNCPECSEDRSLSDELSFDEYEEYCEQHLQPGEVLGTNKAKLKLIQKLGSGAEGAVWYAQDEMHRQLAVKVVRRSVWDGNPELEASLRIMHQRLSQVADANKYLPALHAIDGDDQWVWYTMEAADATANFGRMPAPYTLETHICDSNSDDFIDLAGEVGKRLLLATRWLHHFGLAHNDIKPQNVLRFGGRFWKLGDLGMIGPINNPPVLGTVGYFFDKSQNALEADLAAIARILFRVSTSNQETDEVERRFQALRSEGPRNVRTATRRDAFIHSVVLPAWHEDPSRRFSSADAMLGAIQAFLKDSETETSDYPLDSAVQRSKSPSPPNDLDASRSRQPGRTRQRTVLSGLAVSVVGGLVYAAVGLTSPQPQAHNAALQNAATLLDQSVSSGDSVPTVDERPLEQALPELNLALYENLTPSDEKLATPPPAQGQLEGNYYQVCNRASVGIHLRFVNCSVLKRDRLPLEISENLTLGQYFQVYLPPGGHDNLAGKPFNQTSGSGWYLVFALPNGPADRIADWQLLSPSGAPEAAVNLFHTQNTNLIIREVSNSSFTVEVQQDDEPLQDCANPVVLPPA